MPRYFKLPPSLPPGYTNEEKKKRNLLIEKICKKDEDEFIKRIDELNNFKWSDYTDPRVARTKYSYLEFRAHRITQKGDKHKYRLPFMDNYSDEIYQQYYKGELNHSLKEWFKTHK